MADNYLEGSARNIHGKKLADLLRSDRTVLRREDPGVMGTPLQMICGRYVASRHTRQHFHRERILKSRWATSARLRSMYSHRWVPTMVRRLRARVVQRRRERRFSRSQESDSQADGRD